MYYAQTAQPQPDDELFSGGVVPSSYPAGAAKNASRICRAEQWPTLASHDRQSKSRSSRPSRGATRSDPNHDNAA